MNCPTCGLEMIIYREKEDGGAEYVCRNPNCPQYDRRLSPEENQKEA